MNDREFLRHTVATVAYRAAKAMRGAPETFAEFRPGPTSNSAVQLVAHMGDLFDWALSMATGPGRWNNSTPLPWEQECARFFSALKAFDDTLAAPAPLQYELTRLFQGPVADALTHTGQLAMMRRTVRRRVRERGLINKPLDGDSECVDVSWRHDDAAAVGLHEIARPRDRRHDNGARTRDVFEHLQRGNAGL